LDNRISVVEQQNLDFDDIEDGSEAVERRKDDYSRSLGGGAGGIPLCAVHTQNYITVGARFGPADQGPGRHPDNVKLVERTEVR
jgi:hypothetical protein